MKDPAACTRQHTAVFTLHLHPSQTSNVIEGVREQLDAGLLRCAGIKAAHGLRSTCGHWRGDGCEPAACTTRPCPTGTTRNLGA